jgi:hypothetical protein
MFKKLQVSLFLKKMSREEFEPVLAEPRTEVKNVSLELVIHDNGGRPFKVKTTKQNICTIYKAKYYTKKETTYKEVVWQGAFSHIFRGFDKEYGNAWCKLFIGIKRNK